MRALIVDDEPIARRLLREDLELLSVEVAGEAENGEVALQLISSDRPDVVFLDIQMPVMSGFELLRHLPGEYFPAVVMVTAYDDHAVRAFEIGAIDYLLKPVGQQRLERAVERARRTLKNPREAAEKLVELQALAPTREAEKQRKFIGKIGGEFFLLSLPEILAFQAEGDLVWIVTAKGRYLATQNLVAVEARLKDSNFRRIHRNALINVEKIQKMSMITSQRWLLTLTNGQEFIVSKRQSHQLKGVLSW